MKQARKMLISMGEQSDDVCAQWMETPWAGELLSSPGPHWGQGLAQLCSLEGPIVGSIGSLRLRAIPDR